MTFRPRSLIASFCLAFTGCVVVPPRDGMANVRVGDVVKLIKCLAFTVWPLNGVERAVSLVGPAQERIAGLAHVGMHAFWKMHAALFELTRPLALCAERCRTRPTRGRR